jgi:Flp pilus assembly protein TadD
MNNISEGLIEQGNYAQAAVYARRSASIYPTVSNYNNLGVALEYSENYKEAVAAYNEALKYGNLSIIYENLAEITLLYGNPSYDSQLFQKALNTYPHDYKIWLYLAIMEDAAGANANAKVALAYSAKYGQIPEQLYDEILRGQSFSIKLPIAKTAFEIR